MSEPIVELRDVSRVYLQGDIEVHALRGLSLEIQPGEFTALSGPSGSGKTTTLNMIGAIDSPSSGQVILEGKYFATLSR